jgi:hypothetical protein
MSSKRDAILDTIVSALGGVGKPSGLTVDRHRTIPFGRDVLPAQSVYAVDEEVDTGPGTGSGYPPLSKARRTLKFAVYSRVAVTSTADQDLDPLLSWSVQKICADPTLGSTIHNLKELGTVWHEADQDAAFGGARQFFQAEYFTDSNDPDAHTR